MQNDITIGGYACLLIGTAQGDIEIDGWFIALNRNNYHIIRMRRKGVLAVVGVATAILDINRRCVEIECAGIIADCAL